MKVAIFQGNTHTSNQQHDHKRMVSVATCSLDHSQLDVTSHIHQMSVKEEILYHVKSTNMVTEVNINF
jgi:hypothetical protein